MLNNIEPDLLYTTEEFAKYLNVSLLTAKRYLKKKIVKSFKIGGARRIKGVDILALITNDKAPPNKKIISLKNGVQFYWAQKSAQIAMEIYKNYCKEGDVVMDPFLGAGSSLYGARGLKLKFVGVEINEMPLNITRFNCDKITKDRISNIYLKINSIQKKFNHFYKYKTNNGKSLTLSKIIYHSLPPIKSNISAYFVDQLGTKYSGEKYPEVIEQHISRYALMESKNNKLSKVSLTKNSRIAVKEGMNISEIFSPINFYVLNEIKKIITDDSDMKFILGSVLHLLRLTDTKSQSQFPYWIPKKNILDRNIFDALNKKTNELNNYINDAEITICHSFNDLMKSEGNSCYLINKPTQKLSDKDIPDESVDFILTDPPYFDQVAYSEYLKIWEYFLNAKAFFKDEIVQSQRSTDASDEKEYLHNLEKAFVIINKKLKKDGKIFVYFKDSRPEKFQKFLDIMNQAGFEFIKQEHILKSKYTYKQNTTSETTVTGDCIMQFKKTLQKKEVANIQKNIDIKEVSAVIKDFVNSYLILNRKATIGELYDNGLLKILYEGNYLEMMKNTKEVTSIINEFCNYNKEDRKYSLSTVDFKNKLLFGDCLDILKLIPEQSVDCCITDPPYNISGYDDKKEIGWYKSNKLWSESKRFNKMDENWDKFSNSSYHDFTRDWITEIKRILKPNGNIAIFGSMHNIYRIGAILEELDIRIINSIIWYKRNAFPNITQRMFCESTEQIIWATNNNKKNAKNWVFNYKIMKELNGGKQMRNMWDVPSTPQNERKHGKHPSQKPEEVLDRLTKALTNEGNIIIDPFIGSGTTAVSAKRNDRYFVGIDNNADYLNIAKKRLAILA